MDNKITSLISVLSKKNHISFAYLFGSRVKGCVDRRSDWDIAAYFSKTPEEISPWFVFELEAELSQKIRETVQVIALNTIKSYILAFQIINESVILVRKDEDKRMEFENRILRRYHDWQYFLKRQMRT